MDWTPMIDEFNRIFGEYFPPGFAKAGLCSHGGPRISIGGRDMFMCGDGTVDGSGACMSREWEITKNVPPPEKLDI